MDKIKLVKKLQDKTNINYEEAKKALENNNWDILDAMLYLENKGEIRKPLVSIFYTNEYKDTYNNKGNLPYMDEDSNNSNSRKNNFQGIFEAICKAIDTCNNIFIEIKRNDKVFLKIPLTVLIVLFFFAFWIVIPLMIVSLLFDIEFFVSSKNVDTDKINKLFRDISKNAKDIKEKIKKGFN